jgi:hypothetical protein
MVRRSGKQHLNEKLLKAKKKALRCGKNAAASPGTHVRVRARRL